MTLHCFLADNSNRGPIAGQSFTNLDRLSGTQRGLFATRHENIAAGLDAHCAKDGSVKPITGQAFLALGGVPPDAPVVEKSKPDPAQASGLRVADKPGVVTPGKEAPEPEPVTEVTPLASIEDVLKQSVGVAETEAPPSAPAVVTETAKERKAREKAERERANAAGPQSN